MKERRKYLRLEEEIPFAFERKGPTGTLKGEGITKNISTTGLCLMAKTSLGVGEKIYLTLSLPKVSDPVVLEGRVKWSHPFSVPSPFSHEIGVELALKAGFDQNQYLLFVCDILCTRLEKRHLL